MPSYLIEHNGTIDVPVFSCFLSVDDMTDNLILLLDYMHASSLVEYAVMLKFNTDEIENLNCMWVVGVKILLSTIIKGDFIVVFLYI